MLAGYGALLAIYRRVISNGLGEGVVNAFGSLDIADADFRKLGAGPGDRAVDPFHGLTIRIARIRGAAVTGAGYSLKRYLGGANRDITLAAGSTAAVLNTSATYVDNEIGGAFISTTGGTGPNQHRVVMEYDSAANATITVAKRDFGLDIAATSTPDALPVVPDNTTTVSIFAPWEYTQTTAATDIVSAIALGAVTQDNWTLVVERGPVPHRCVGSTDALVQNGFVVPSATGGTGKGPTAAGMTAVEASLCYAVAMSAYSGAAALRLVQLLGKFMQ